jgi:hypothetical protein
MEERGMKYEVGDKVKVRSDLQHGQAYDGCLVTKEMEQLSGKTVTISYYSDNSDRYDIKESYWKWTDEMFEGLAKGGRKNDKSLRSDETCGRESEGV